MNIVVIIILIIIILLSFYRLKYGIYFIILITPFAFLINNSLDFNLLSKIWHNILAAILFCLLLARHSLRGKNIKLNKLDWVIILTLCYGIFQVIRTYLLRGDLYLGLQGFRINYIGTLLYFVVRDCIKRENTRQFTKMVLIAVFLIAIELILEYILINTGVDMEILPWARKHIYGSESMLRPYGIFYSIQITATFVLIGALITLPFFFDRNISVRTKEIVFTSFFYIFIWIALILSTSRIIIFIFFGFIFYYMTVISKKRIQNTPKLVFLLIPVIIMTLINPAMFNFVFAGILKGEDVSYSIAWRSVLPFIEYVKGSIFSIIVGNGFMLDPFGINDVDEIAYAAGGTEIHFFNYIYETGLIGAILFIILNILAYKFAMNIAKNEINPIYKNIFIGFSFVGIGILLSTLHYFPLGHPGIHYIYYTILGIISSLYLERKNILSPKHELI